MNFIERWFHISPDNGDGTFEVAIVIAVLVIACGLVFRKRISASLRKLRSRRTV
jgi:hypothetical protein